MRQLIGSASQGSLIGVVMVLCVCVLLQMLGTPVTLLNPSAFSDTLGASVLEGFTVPPALLSLDFSAESVPAPDVHPSVHIPLLSSMVFHPPVL